MSDFLFISLASDEGRRRRLVMAEIPSLFSEGIDEEPEIPVKSTQTFRERIMDRFANAYGHMRQRLELAFREERRLRDENLY